MRISVGMLFGHTTLWIIREEMISEIQLQSVDEIKNDLISVGGEHQRKNILSI